MISIKDKRSHNIPYVHMLLSIYFITRIIYLQITDSSLYTYKSMYIYIFTNNGQFFIYISPCIQTTFSANHTFLTYHLFHPYILSSYSLLTSLFQSFLSSFHSAPKSRMPFAFLGKSSLDMRLKD